MTPPKYLYLTQPEWARTWVCGGLVPISCASTYLRNTRDGVYTPDETLIHESPVDLTKLPFIKINKEKGFGHISMINVAINGKIVPDLIDAKYYREDGLILSFSNSASSSIAKKLGKRACVKIIDIDSLKHDLDLQIGIKSVMEPCLYTISHIRNHFIKSTDDAWQDEFRIFWPCTSPRSVLLKPGVAHRIKLKHL